VTAGALFRAAMVMAGVVLFAALVAGLADWRFEVVFAVVTLALVMDLDRRLEAEVTP
jgi:hypothetical protein